jgi:hypothetical protein
MSLEQHARKKHWLRFMMIWLIVTRDINIQSIIMPCQ